MTSAIVSFLIAQVSWGDPVRAPDHAYWEARKLALATGKVLVIGVGCDPPAGDWLTCRTPAPWHGWHAPCLIVARVREGDLDWVADLPARSSAESVRRMAELARPAVLLPHRGHTSSC